MKSRKGLIALLLSMVLIIAAGCQSVGGLDFNSALKQSLKVTSSEGNQTMEFKLLLKENAAEGLDPEEAAMMELFSNVKLELTDIKMNKEQHFSTDGVLSLGSEKIGFSVYSDHKQAVIHIDGAKRPFVFNIKDIAYYGYGLPELEEAAADAETNAELEAKVAELQRKVMETASGFIIEKLPNPKRISVKPGSETVHNEKLTGMHVEADIDGSELLPWVQSFLSALISDPEGVKNVLTELIRITSEQPDLWESLGVADPFSEEYLEGKTKEQLAAEGADGFIKFLKEIKTELDSAINDSDYKEILNANSYLKYNLFVDSKLDIRKSAVTAVFKPGVDQSEEFMASPLEGFSLNITSESWNVNGIVTPVKPSETSVYYGFDQVFNSESFQMLQFFNEDSTVYNLLKKFGMNKQSLYFGEYDDHPPIVLPQGLTLLPLRDTLDQFGASLDYTEDDTTFKIYDKPTNTRISIVKDADSLTVNGNVVKWSSPTTKVDGTLYVPARDLIQALGGKLHWEDWGDDYRILIAEREL